MAYNVKNPIKNLERMGIKLPHLRSSTEMRVKQERLKSPEDRRADAVTHHIVSDLAPDPRFVGAVYRNVRAFLCQVCCSSNVSYFLHSAQPLRFPE